MLERLNPWLQPTVGSRESLVVVEIETGFNIPAVIRWPVDRLTDTVPGARLIRPNRDHPDVPAALAPRTISSHDDATTVIEYLHTALTGSNHP